MTSATRWSGARKLFALVNGMRRRIALGVGLILAGSALTLVYPLVIARLVDGAVQRGGLALLLALGGCLLGLFLARSVVSFFGGFILESSGETIVNTLRKRLFSSLMQRNLSFYHGQRVGDLASRLHSDTATIRDAVTMSIVSVLNQTFIFIGALVVMASMNWRLTLIVLAISPFAALISERFGPLLENASRTIRTHSGDALAAASESFLGIQTIHVLNRQSAEADKYEVAVDAALRAAIQSVRLSSLLGGILSFLSSLVSVVVFIYGGVQVVSGAMTAGILVAFLFYSENITQSVSAFSAIYANLLSALVSSSRVFELLEQGESASSAPASADATSLSGVGKSAYVALDRISFSYDGMTDVIDEVSFSVARGELIGLVGRSGCGKSTIASLICRLHEIERGVITIDDCDISSMALEELRREMTLVTQDAFLFNNTIFENIRMGRPGASDEEVVEAADIACLNDLAVSLPKGYDTPVGERGAMLSGGQKQRIAIARAFLRNPSLLVLDEATSALDTSTEKMIMANVAAKCRMHGLCAIVITHRPTTMSILDHLVVLEAGRIAEQGRYQDLKIRGGALSRVLGEVTKASEEVVLGHQPLGEDV